MRLIRKEWPTFCGLCCFATNLNTNQRQRNDSAAKRRKPQKRRKAKAARPLSPATTIEQCRSQFKLGYKLFSNALLASTVGQCPPN